MTSADLPLPGVGIYLRGVSPAPEAPQTSLAWRRDVADLVLAGPEAASAALSFFPLLGAELARAPTPYARQLIARSLARAGSAAFPSWCSGAAGAPPDRPPLAKSRRGRLRAGALGGYRHELGSLADAERALPLERLGADALRLGGVELDWWRAWGHNRALRTWSGQQSAWTVHRALGGAALGADPREWPCVCAPARARLHLDPAGSWNALDLGFSANEHRAAPVCCRPLVELLASLGLQAFPVRRTRDGFGYRLWTPTALPGALAAFSGKGRFVHALGAFEVRTGRTGRNTTLRRASPLEVLVPGLRPTSEGKP